MVPPETFSVPSMRLSIVLLPAPFGPIRPTISPSSTDQVDVVHRGQTTEVAAELVDLEQRQPGHPSLGSSAARDRSVGDHSAMASAGPGAAALGSHAHASDPDLCGRPARPSGMKSMTTMAIAPVSMG